jgi:hypothetical protein
MHYFECTHCNKKQLRNLAPQQIIAVTKYGLTCRCGKKMTQTQIQPPTVPKK